MWSANPDVEASIRANEGGGFLFLINHEAQQANTHVELADLPLVVGRIMDLAENRPVESHRQGGIVRLTMPVPLGETKLMICSALCF